MFLFIFAIIIPCANAVIGNVPITIAPENTTAPPLNLTGRTNTSAQHLYVDVASVYYVAPLESGKSQEGSEKICSDMSGRLATIDTTQKLTDINYLLDPIVSRAKTCDLPLWIGGRYNKSTETWTWPRIFDINVNMHIGWCKGFPKPITTASSSQQKEVSNSCMALGCGHGMMWCFINYLCNADLSYICEKSAPVIQPLIQKIQPPQKQNVIIMKKVEFKLSSVPLLDL